jgi:uncharacterized membrane protein
MRLVELRVFGASPVPFEFRQMTAPGVAMSSVVAEPPASPQPPTAPQPAPPREPSYGAGWQASGAVAPQPTRETAFEFVPRDTAASEAGPVAPPAAPSDVDYDAILRARFGRPQPAPVRPSVPRADELRLGEAQRDVSQPHVPQIDAPPFVASETAASSMPPASGEATAARASAPGARVRKPINWELFAGGRLLNVAGALALVVGVVLLMKYALDENWINAQMRVAAGLVFGIGMLAGGHIAQMRRPGSWFAQGIVGAGIGVLYASGYAAFDGYHLIPSLAAYAFLCVVTFAAFGLALKYDSVGLAVIGWAGGFATPFVTGGGASNAFGLASYLLILDGGLLAISIVKRRWFVMAPLAIAGSYVTALAWYVQNGARESATVSAIALVSLWLVFFAAEIVEALRDPKRNVVLRTAASVANAVVFYTFLDHVLAQSATALEVVTAIAAFGYAVAYAVLVRRAPDVVALRWNYAAAATLFAAFGCAERFSGETLATVYALAGLAIAAIARLRRSAASSVQTLREVAVVSFGLLFAAYVSEFVAGVLAGATWNVPGATHDIALVALALASFATERFLRYPSLDGLYGFVTRQVGLGALVCLEAAHVHGFALGAVLALDALALAALDRGLRSRGLLYGIAFESTVVAGAFMLAAAAVDATTPGAFGGGAFGPGLAGRDVAGLVWIAAAFCLAALVRDGSPQAAGPASAFRRSGIVAIGILEALHVSGYALSTLYACDAIAFALGDRLLRVTGRRSGASFEPLRIATAFCGIGLAVAAIQGTAFDFVAGGLHLGFATRDGALVAFLVAAFALERLLVEGSSRSALAGTTLRVLGLVAVVASDVTHARGFGLAVLFALEGCVLAGVDRSLRALGTRYAPEAETFVSGVTFVCFAWTAGAFAALLDPASAAVGRNVAFGFGGVDLALVSLLCASLFYVNLAGRGGFAGPVLLALRQSAVATVFAAIGAHLTSYEACGALSIASVGLSVAASRTRARDLRVDGVVSLAVSMLLLAAEPATWQAVSVVNLVPLVNERFAAFALASIATFVASELYLRSSDAVPVLGRGGRVAAFLVAIVGATLEVRDAFAHALEAYPIGSAPYVRLESLEQLSISGVWIVASLALVTFGIRARVRELRVVAIGLFDLTILKAFFIDLHSLDTPYRIASFIGLGLTLLFVSFVYQRLEKGFFGPAATVEETSPQAEGAA